MDFKNGQGGMFVSGFCVPVISCYLYCIFKENNIFVKRKRKNLFSLDSELNKRENRIPKIERLEPVLHSATFIREGLL